VRSRRLPFGAAELTTDADTGTQGVVIWLGTKSERRARREAPTLIPFPNELDLVALSIERERETMRRIRKDLKGRKS
jgi:hypothetical protein